MRSLRLEFRCKLRVHTRGLVPEASACDLSPGVCLAKVRYYHKLLYKKPLANFPWRASVFDLNLWYILLSVALIFFMIITANNLGAKPLLVDNFHCKLFKVSVLMLIIIHIMFSYSQTELCRSFLVYPRFCRKKRETKLVKLMVVMLLQKDRAAPWPDNDC